MSWDERFSGEHFHYGTEPAAFVTAQAWRLTRGAHVLSVAEGEGRNAVWLAAQGLCVHALDGSAPALSKAHKLAAERGVTITSEHADLSRYIWPVGAYDAVFGVFIQFAPPALRGAIFRGMAQALKPGGLLFLNGFSVRQLKNSSGGPKAEDHLWTLDLLRDSYPDWEWLHQADYDAHLDEGPGHSGRAALIDFIARKPKA
ncbi:methyltransferase family protein [Rhodobacter aestuarii]|uniref:Methyltransferase domain-containing protein n=1 Tax=Rhodobacter aestuarii TaxID=453582 RepID=A0A1N7N8T2_9RHOB|nr:class I SAM-dependent methyltransferase [Rhodobacter aestuarii]PTV96305.1 methyltransferase family protein [Rhodobacter aestuarii]SIS94755.1 Methyltransferase domain-containing protein [Rhodobacter aestuarii]